MKDFFISYNSADRDWAEWIAWQLEEANYSTVLQVWDFAAGSNFALDMQKAATEAARTIAVLSAAYLAAQFTQPEWTAAFVQDPTGEKGILLPVRIGQSELKGLWPAIVYISLVGMDESSAKDALLSKVRQVATGERAKPATAPQFPGAPARSVSKRPRFPGSLPPIWNVPHRRNRNFTGRLDLLESLHSRLTSGQTAALVQALSGLGGIGKTQTAVEYAYRHAGDYEVVWWVRAEDPATLAGDFAALAQELKLPESSVADQGLVIAAARRWLERNSGWLVIFDNVPVPKDVEEYIPAAASGHVIVTSREPNWGGLGSRLPVSEMTSGEAIEFLLKRTQQEDLNAANALSQEVANLPLALEQAAGYIEATGAGLDSYVTLFRSRRRELWSEERPPSDYKATVATTWSLAMENVRRDSSESGDLLNLCAYLAPDDVRLTLLREGATHIPSGLADAVTDELALNRAIAALRRYSLVEVNGGALSIHRMVQAVTRDSLSDTDQRKWAQVAVEIVNAAFPFDSDDVRNWSVCGRTLMHATTATQHSEVLGMASEAVGTLLNHTGRYLHGRASYARAESLYQRALGIREKVLEPDHPDVAWNLNDLGVLYYNQGRLTEAEPLHRLALAIREKTLGPDHRDMANSLNNLGETCAAQWRLAEAEPLLRRGLAIREKTLEPDHPLVAQSLNNLAGIYNRQGRFPEGERLLLRALAILEKAVGRDHPNVAITISNLASLYRQKGQLVEAERLSQRALAIHDKTLGPDHPVMANSLTTLALVYLRQGRLAEAESLHQRAMAARENTLGPDHPEVADSLTHLATVYKDQGRLSEAEPLYERALAIYEKALGPDHPDVANCLVQYALLHREQKRGKRARLLETRAQAIRSNILRRT
jgi:tetratricopeptide (TPR) repeat protein